MQWSDEGIILSVRSHGETSAVVENLEPGVTYTWRLVMTTPSGRVASPDVMVRANVCPPGTTLALTRDAIHAPVHRRSSAHAAVATKALTVHVHRADGRAPHS